MVFLIAPPAVLELLCDGQYKPEASMWAFKLEIKVSSSRIPPTCHFHTKYAEALTIAHKCAALKPRLFKLLLTQHHWRAKNTRRKTLTGFFCRHELRQGRESNTERVTPSFSPREPGQSSWPRILWHRWDSSSQSLDYRANILLDILLDQLGD